MTVLPFPDKRYQLIYADPPWAYDDARTHKSTGMALSAYPCMSMDELIALPVASIAERFSILCMWCTWPKITQGLILMEAWGFKYSTAAFVWLKLRPNANPNAFSRHDIYAGLGHYTRANTEFVLLGRRGNGLPRADLSMRQVVMEPEIVTSPRGKHSAKPDEVRYRLRVMFGEVSRIELFARESVPGFDAWGLEV